MYMIEIFKNYYQLIKDDQKKLIPYYISYFLDIIIGLIIPIVVANITENLTNSLYLATIISILTYFTLKMISSLITYLEMHNYANFFKDNYVTLYKKVVKEIYNFDQNYNKKFSGGRIINSLTSDIINIGEMADNILKFILNIIRSIIVLIYFMKINIVFSIFLLLVDIIYINRSNYLNNMIAKYLIKQKEENDKLIGLINQTILGLKDIQTLDFSNSIDNKYKPIYKKWQKLYYKKRKYQIFKRSILESFLILVKIVVYFICCYLIMNNKMNIGVMLIIISYFDSLLIVVIV